MKPSINKQKPQTIGFGVPTTDDPHHFIVNIPRGSTGKVEIREHLGLQGVYQRDVVIDRAVLDKEKWDIIADNVKRDFNARLSKYGVKPAKWLAGGDNPVDRLLGKELCVLVWAIEEMDIEKIPTAFRNWYSLRQEDRWWLFGVTAEKTGTPADAGKGWRAALYYALGDGQISL